MIDVLRYRKVTLAISLAIIFGSLGYSIYLYKTRGYVFNYSVDFTGGTQVLFKFNKPVSAHLVKEAVEKKGWRGAIVREFENNEVLVRVKEFSTDSKGLSSRIQQAIETEISDLHSTVLQNETVSASVGESLRAKSLYAVLLGLLAMVVYIGIIRFRSTAFAIGTVVSLAHDAIVVLAAFMILDREISTHFIEAILMTIGYSINDTIVIFSQIRDNLKKMKNAPLEEVVTVSINQTLRRSILTSAATTMAVLAMLLFGGEAFADMSLALLIGIVFGTYSSIYIASPSMMLVYSRRSENSIQNA
jgi:preprotein translocase subunit SecF